MQCHSVVDRVPRPDVPAADQLHVGRASCGVAIKVAGKTALQKTQTVHRRETTWGRVRMPLLKPTEGARTHPGEHRPRGPTGHVHDITRQNGRLDVVRTPEWPE